MGPCYAFFLVSLGFPISNAWHLLRRQEYIGARIVAKRFAFSMVGQRSRSRNARLKFALPSVRTRLSNDHRNARIRETSRIERYDYTLEDIIKASPLSRIRHDVVNKTTKNKCQCSYVFTDINSNESHFRFYVQPFR